MLCIHSDISNKPGLTADLSTSTSHASDSELDSVDIKPVIVDAACSENSCLNKHVMRKSNESGTRGKFVHTCHNCGKTGHIRPNCYLLKSHRPWIKQDALRKSEKILPHLNMSLLIGDIQKVRAMLFVRMLIKILQRMSRSIQKKEACPPVITAASPITSDPNVHSSRLKIRRFRRSYHQELH
jgi:hypothetical protein